VISSLFLPPTSTNPPLLPTSTSSIQPISGSTGALQLLVTSTSKDLPLTDIPSTSSLVSSTSTASVQPISESTGVFQFRIHRNIDLKTAAFDRIHRTINQLSRIVNSNGFGSAYLRVYRCVSTSPPS
jgi:hypothetical protein